MVVSLGRSEARHDIHILQFTFYNQFTYIQRRSKYFTFTGNVCVAICKDVSVKHSYKRGLGLLIKAER